MTSSSEQRALDELRARAPSAIPCGAASIVLAHVGLSMSALNPTPPELLVDTNGRPYFLWDADTTLAQFLQQLRTEDRTVRAYLVGKLMRQAKPDDVFTFVTVAEIRDLWRDVQPYLGRTRDFWQWLMTAWGQV